MVLNLLPATPWEGLKRHSTINSEETKAQGQGFLTLEGSTTLRERPKYRFALLLPYLNVESLRDDDSLLLCLLRNRTQFPPSAWATLDLQQSSFGRHSGLLERIFDESCFSIAAESYGETLPYSEGPFHNTGGLIGFPNAEILFEAQQKLYSILRGVVSDLLRGCTRGPTESPKWEQAARSMFVITPASGPVTPATQFPRVAIGIGRAADRHVCSQPSSMGSLRELADTFANSARIIQQDAERELLSLQVGTCWNHTASALSQTLIVNDNRRPRIYAYQT